jgi:hypothetical protein
VLVGDGQALGLHLQTTIKKCMFSGAFLGVSWNGKIMCWLEMARLLGPTMNHHKDLDASRCASRNAARDVCVCVRACMLPWKDGELVGDGQAPGLHL